MVSVAVLSPYPHEIADTFELSNDRWIAVDNISVVTDAHYVVSYGHDRLIKEPDVTRLTGRIINLHLSFLPWNRGSDPNLWSFIDDTPKGVTIHVLDAGLDTGPILAQREVALSGTLRTSYHQLRTAMAALFKETWPRLRIGGIKPIPQLTGIGACHKYAERTEIWSRFSKGYDTPLGEVQAVGAALRAGRAHPL